MSTKEMTNLSTPKARLADLGPPVLLDGEDPAAFDRLLAQVTEAVRPADVLEEIGVRDVVDLLWEAKRLRRLKTSLIRSSTSTGLAVVLRGLTNPFTADELVKQWYARDEDARTKVAYLLEEAGLTMDDVHAQTLAKKLPEIERIDRMIALAEGRRNSALREIERHRATLATRLRDAIQDAQYSDVQPEDEDEDERLKRYA